MDNFKKSKTPWRILVVDDDQGVHDSTEFILDDFEFLGEEVELVDAHSAKEAQEILEKDPSIAIAIVDIVMEGENAGLELINYIRGNREYDLIRLIVRTGQPGSYPEGQVFLDYDIHSYLDKSDLSASKLTFNVTSAFRSFHDLLKIKYYSQSLEKIVDEKTKELQIANAKLKEENSLQEELLIEKTKMADLGKMIGFISHQMKQPLNALSIISCDLVEAYAFEELDKEYLDNSVGAFKNNIKFLTQTIDDFRLYIKDDREKQDFDLELIVSETLRLIAAITKNKNVLVLSDIEPNISIYGTPNELKQVILNIVNNAVDQLTKENLRKGEVKILGKRSNSTIEIVISDNGAGIPEELLPEKIFSGVTTKGDAGTGMGLSMSKTIIEKKFNGVISAFNNNGAYFKIEIPT